MTHLMINSGAPVRGSSHTSWGGSSHTQFTLSVGWPLFLLAPFCSWEELWFLVVLGNRPKLCKFFSCCLTFELSDLKKWQPTSVGQLQTVVKSSDHSWEKFLSQIITKKERAQCVQCASLIIYTFIGGWHHKHGYWINIIDTIYGQKKPPCNLRREEKSCWSWDWCKRPRRRGAALRWLPSPPWWGMVKKPSHLYSRTDDVSR